MTTVRLPPVALLAEFDVSHPEFIEETAVANIWKVRRSNGQLAALKAYKSSNMSNEGPGFSFIESLCGVSAAVVFERNATCALIEWLDGPSLGDVSRAGDDEKASIELVEVANKIHSVSHANGLKLQPLDDWFAALFACDFGPDCPDAARRNILKCQKTAQDLLANPRDVRPLHGDLHHDNIKRGDRGYCAFDAKGVVGERTFELANAFRNPKGAPELVRDPERIRYLRHLWAHRYNVDPLRLMQWATVKAALSIVWRGSGTVETDPEFDLLAVFLTCFDERRS